MENILYRIENRFSALFVFSVLFCAGVQAQTFPTPGFTLPAGKTICITYEVDVNANVCPSNTFNLNANLSNQSNVSGSNFTTVQTDDPDIAGTSNPTLTPFTTLTIGDRVFKDNNLNGIFDVGDVGIGNVTMLLYQDNGDGVLTAADGASIALTATLSTPGPALGFFAFANLCPGNYIVEVAPSNFLPGGALYDNTLMAGLISSPLGGAPDPDTDIDNDDNGDPVAGFGVATAAVTLTYGGEPTTDGDGNNNTNMTVDFGFRTPTTVTISDFTLAEGNAGTTNFNFTVTRSSTAEAFSLTVNTADGTATSPSDFTAISGGTVSFTAGGASMQTVTVAVNGDLAVESNEAFTVVLSGAPGGVVITDASGTGTINNDDNATVTLSGGIAQNEGNAGTTSYTFTATLNNPVQGGFSVAYTTNNGSATTADNDYVDNDGSLSFSGNAGETKTFVVQVNGDTKVESDETFTTALGAISGTSLSGSITTAGSPQTGTITNDDNATVTLSGGIAQNEGNAGTTSYIFTATLNNAVAGGFTVAYTTNDGTATTADNDYVDNDGSLTFTGTAGETKTITVLVNGDTKVENNETFTVALGAISGTTLGASLSTAGSPQTGTINNDDSAVVTLSGGAAQNEGNTGTTPYIFTATLNNAVQGGFSVAHTTNDGTATTADNDYADNDASLLFSGTAGETKNITVLVNGDLIIEANENFTVALGAISGAPTGVTTAGSPQTGTITNDEQDWGDAPTSAQSGFAGTYPTLSANTGARHSAALNGLRLGATIDGDLDGQPNPTATGDGSDEDGVTLPASLVLNISASVTVNVANGPGLLQGWVDFNRDGDWADAGEQVFTNVSVANGANNLTFLVPAGASIGTSFARFRLSTTSNLGISGPASDGEVEDYQVSIQNVALSVNDVAVTEGNAGTTIAMFTVSLNNPAPAGGVTFDITTADNTATTGNSDYVLNTLTSQTIPAGSTNYNFNVIINGDQVVEGNETFFVNVTNVVGAGVSDAQGQGTINNDDLATLTFSGGASHAEGGIPFTFTANIDKAVQGGFTIAYNTNDGTATVADNDYTDNDGTLTFSGAANETQTFVVNSTPDNKVELDETFTAALAASVSGTSAVQIAAITVTGSPQTGTITNDDGAMVALAGSVSQAESLTPQIFTVTLTNPVDVPVTVVFSTTNNTASTVDNDYNGIASQTVTFPAGTTTSQSVSVTINNDNKVEANEIYNVNIGSLNASGRNVSLGLSGANGTIVNDDNATVTLTPSSILMQNEGNTGTTPFVFTLTLDNPVQGGFSIPYTTSNGLATTANNDYVDNDGILGFTGTMNEAHTITVLVNGDFIVEVNEDFVVALGAITGAPAGVTVSGSPQSGLIVNDEIDWGDAPDSYGTLLASNGARHSTSLVVHLGASVDGDADGQPGALANGDDTDAEGDDDDGVTLPSVLVTGTAASITVNASINGFLNGWVDFNLNGNFNDPGDLVFNQTPVSAGNNNLTIAVPSGATVGNSFARFRFTQGAVAAVPTGLQTTGEVEDYAIEIVNTQFNISDVSVIEGNAGTTNLTFAISRTVNANASSVDYAITGGTATSGTDYQPLASGTINFTALGPLSQNVTIVVNGDQTVELDETIIVTLSNPVGGSILDGTGIESILNDDAAVITITSPTIVEGDGGTTNLAFTINMSNPSDANVDLNNFTVDGTATTANNDYTLTNGSQTFTPGQTSKTVSVPIIGDCAIEPNESFIVRLGSLSANGRNVIFSGGGAQLDGTGTITNDDALPVITCLGNITTNAAAGVCNATVTLTQPNTSSVCGSGTLEFHYRTVDASNVPTGPYNAFAPAASNSVNLAVGRYEVEWRITDGSGASSCSYFVQVVDNQPPSAQCVTSFNLNLNAGGTGSVTAANINNGSSDNCSIVNMSVAPNSFTCANVGPVTVTLTVTDPANLTGTCTSTVNVIASAACTPPAIGNSGGPDVADPCTCLGNGRFSEEVVIGPSNPGQLWVVQSTTLINPATNAPYAPGTAFTQVNVGGGQVIYVLPGVHLDGVGYTITATSVYFPNSPLTISNTCYYPDPVITGPEGVFCANSADGVFSGTAGANIDGTGQFFLNGNPIPTVETPVNSNNWVTTLDFSTLSAGNYTLVFQFDAGNPAGLLPPPNVGCTASVSRVFTVVNTPSNLVCNDNLHITLDESCSLELNPDDILEGTYLCYDDYLVQLDRTLPLGNGPWQPGILGPSDVHHTYAVRVVHIPSGNSCWGTILVEDKLPPVLECPCTATEPTEGCTYTCADKDGILNGSIVTPAPVAVDGCEGPITTIVTNPAAPGANLYKKDVFIDGGACGVSRIERTWTAKDSWGNSAQCTQVFYLEPYDLDEVNFPEDITIECAGCGQNVNTQPCETGVPTVDGNDADGVYEIITYNGQCQVQSEGICNLGAQKDDVRIQVCPGTYKILRHWTVLDWCTNTFIEHDQLIKVVDSEGPAIATPGDMTVSTNPSQCCATVNLPDVIVEDACSATANISAMVVVYDQYLPDQIIGTYNINGNTLSTFPGNNFWDCDTLGRYGITPCLPIGHHQVMYMAEDVCGNTNQITFWLTVVDDVAPVATCTQFTTVAIGVDDPTDCYEPTEDCQFGGVTWVPASAFDQGSHDNCNPIDFTIRRMPEADGTYSDCIDGLSPLCDGYEYNVATTENDSIKFYCCEVGTTQTVILRVYQLDINGNRDYYRNPDGSPLTDPDGAIQYIYNECMINVEVQDKIKPICQAPAFVTVNCENFEPSLWAYGYPSISDNCCLDDTPPTSANPQGQVGIPSGTTAIPGVCGATQKTYYSGFLNANFDTTCNRGVIIRRFTAWDCQGQSSSCTQRITVTNQQAYTVQFPADKLVNCVTAPDFGKPVITNDEGCELVGTAYNDVVFTIVPDACYKIERTWTIINWCSYIPDNPCTQITRNPVNQTTGLAPSKTVNVTSENCLTYKQIIKVIDQTPPTVTCQDIDTCDYSTNNPRYWNYGDNWWDNGTMQHDLCEKSTNIAVTAEDFCDTLSPTGGLRFRYLLFLDLDGDQIMETVVSSADAVTRPLAAVLYGNYNTALYHGGVQWLFDNTSTANQKYRFDIEQTANGARVIWRNAAGSVIDPELAHGRHKIKWIAEDGCGNEAVCEKTFEIRDCKPPVVACANVNINLMVGGMATLWASDFFLYGDDNCTPDAILEQKLAVIRADENPGNQFPTDLPQSIVVTCADQGTLVPVQVWLQDAAGNADFCIAYVDVQANIVGCPQGNTATVAGALATEDQSGVEDANVELAVSASNGQNILNDMSDASGNFQFPSAVPVSGNYVLTPTKDDNPLNGVTTYDLVLISKHILGLEPLTTPYKMIAADANRSGSITTFDIVEFRKLILGIYDELPNNTSWRFVDKGYNFPNPANPFQTQFPENISVQNVQADQLAEDFVGIKVGDVNATVVANSLQSAEERTASTMLFDVEDRAVKAGETFTVNFKGAERVQGYQFTMNLTGLEVMDIAANGDIKAENFGVFDGAITTSVDGSDNEFAITFRATKAGQLSSMLGVSSRITKAEAYSLANNRMDVALRFNNNGTSTISGVGFELYQNQPNPFVNKTFIGFHLPEATTATLRIFDETGRMVFTQSGSFAKGYNTISVDRQLLNTVGVLYYTLETATDSATKKMIQSK